MGDGGACFIYRRAKWPRVSSVVDSRMFLAIKYVFQKLCSKGNVQANKTELLGELISLFNVTSLVDLRHGFQVAFRTPVEDQLVSAP